MKKIKDLSYVWFALGILVVGFVLLRAILTTRDFSSRNRDPREICIDDITLDIEQTVSEEKGNQALPQIMPKEDAIRVPIFVYHSVRPYIEGESKYQDMYDVTPELFEKQLIYLRDHGYTVVSLDDVTHYFAVGTTTDKNPVVLTFDDGWRNQFTYAYPLLKKYHMTATFYVFTHALNKKHYLTWDELREMHASGMTIASHTLSHPYLNKLDNTALQKEIFQSKKILEDTLGFPVIHFASPFGYSDSNVVELIRQAGYVTGRTIYRGVYHDSALSLRGNLVTDDFDTFVRVLDQR